jgi:CHASE3 domain sensor protein
MANLGRKRTSRPSPAQSTTSILDGSQEYLRTLQRQHKITLRRVENIQRQLDALPQEEDRAEHRTSSLADWFLRLMGH